MIAPCVKAVNLCNKSNPRYHRYIQLGEEKRTNMKPKILRPKFLSMALALALAVSTAPLFARAPQGDLGDAVRHELVMLPYYNVFDDLGYQVDGSTVILNGDVTQPVLKSDAENAVKRIPGVTNVINDIRVLPLSPFDNQTRRAVYRSVFSFGSLYRYAMGANPSIHIIVDNGHVILKGVVDNEGDKNLAYIRANGVPGVFSVTNELRVAEK
jgi:hyperosmotically inducible periplasmic protein